MRHISLILIIFVCIMCLSCDQKSPPSTDNTPVQVIPKPSSQQALSGHFKFNNSTSLYASSDFVVASGFLRKYLQNGARIPLIDAPEGKAEVVFNKDTMLAKEAYELHISEEKISITAATDTGAFYAVQTLRQLLPASLERINSMPNQSIPIACVKIKDAPKFKYRGMHLDVARHFFPKEFIKEYIAALAMLKMNYFHWHLTDDQGWRIEIKEYPRLSTHSAFRNETLIGHYNESPQQFDGKRYGGFYTQEDVKEIVEFATAHHVTVIPEIEMPGHAQAAISAFPELGCTGENIEVATKWGVFENVFCPNQKTFAFLKNVLTEVMELFPGEYIHIGGDEAPKTQWKTCQHCQDLIKTHNLKDEHGLQSYFIKEIEAFVNSKGKKIIGWDEILEGGLAPNATVMSWRGTEGAITAAKAGHDVIMTPTSHAYFDYYQAEHDDEPLAIGGFLPLKKVYSFNPIPEELNAEESEFVLGAQGNIWTEYLKTEDRVMYMAFPRMLAMSEVVWSGPQEKLEKEYSDFLTRVEAFFERLDALNINYANHLYDLEGEVIKENDSVFYTFKTALPNQEIFYALNEDPKLYTYEKPIPILKNTVIGAYISKNDTVAGRRFLSNIEYHKGINSEITLNVAPHKAYSAGGTAALNNGISGSNSRFGDKEWLGFWGDDLEITIDLDKETEVSRISTRFYNANGQWIYAPKKVIVVVSLDDGRQLSTLMNVTASSDNIMEATLTMFGEENSVNTSKIELRIPSYGKIPDGLQGAGNNAWTFIDEIKIE